MVASEQGFLDVAATPVPAPALPGAVICDGCGGEIVEPCSPKAPKKLFGKTPPRVAWWRGLLSFPGTKPCLEKKRKKAPASVHTAWARLMAKETRQKRSQANTGRSTSTPCSISKSSTTAKSEKSSERPAPSALCGLSFSDVITGVVKDSKKDSPVVGSAVEVTSFNRQSIVLRGDYQQEIDQAEKNAKILQQRKCEKLKDLRSTQNIWREKHNALQKRKSINTDGQSALPGDEPASTTRSASFSTRLRTTLTDRRKSADSFLGQSLPVLSAYTRTFSRPTTTGPMASYGLLQEQEASFPLFGGKSPSNRLASSRSSSKERRRIRRSDSNGSVEAPHVKESRAPSKEADAFNSGEANADEDEFHFESALTGMVKIGGHNLNLPEPVSFQPVDEVEEQILEICRTEEMDIIEVDKMKRIFNKFDLDQSGYIGEDEFRGLIFTLSNSKDQYDLPESRLKYLWQSVDTDRNAKIEFIEFVQWWSKYSDLFAGDCRGGEHTVDDYIDGISKRSNGTDRRSSTKTSSSPAKMRRNPTIS